MISNKIFVIIIMQVCSQHSNIVITNRYNRTAQSIEKFCSGCKSIPKEITIIEKKANDNLAKTGCAWTKKLVFHATPKIDKLPNKMGRRSSVRLTRQIY